MLLAVSVDRCGKTAGIAALNLVTVKSTIRQHYTKSAVRPVLTAVSVLKAVSCKMVSDFHSSFLLVLTKRAVVTGTCISTGKCDCRDRISGKLVSFGDEVNRTCEVW